MSTIHLLDNFTANSIAAGEVVERPSSVVKELVENSLDAGASVITVEIKQGGIRLIRVTDNGVGLDDEDARLAFKRHATSKITKIDDLQELHTMGFRGEALASISAVSEVTLETRQPGAEQGIQLKLVAGDIVQETVSGCPVGTTIQIENLFFNTPARYKFLKRDQTEASYVTDLIERLSLARPDISFRLINQEQEILHTPGNDDLMSSIFSVYGKSTAQSCLPVSFEESPVSINGFVTAPDVSRHNRNRQNVFVNGRLIKSRMITAAIDEACHTWFMKSRYPAVVLKITLPVPLVDVNVHPQKMEVRFWDEKKIFHCIFHAIKQALINGSGIAGEEENKTVDTNASEIKSSISSSEENKIVQEHSQDKENEQYSQIELSTDEPQMPRHEQVYNKSYEQASQQLSDQDRTLKSDQEKISEYDQDNASKSDQENNERIDTIMRARIIGQAFMTYLILECDNELYLVDQHAAHERILYEKLVNRNKERIKNNDRQPLLVPEKIQVTRSEKQKLLDVCEEILNLGFEFDDFGPETLLLRSVPAQTGDLIKPGAAFRIIIDSLVDNNLTSPDSLNRIYENIACKAAVKAHDLLHESEMERLLKDLQQLENPYHCPHGRPVIVKMSKYELEKKFKRIV